MPESSSRKSARVNGADVWFLKIDCEVKKIPFAYSGYFFSDQNSLVRVTTYTGKNLADEFEKDFTEFLNGLHVE
jgi:hypothetical protein